VRVQLWSYNYAPEPTGIAPLSTAWVAAMRALGHDVDVVAAHPHYPAPRWGTRLLPYRERRDGVAVLRLPIWVGRATAAQRIRQELSHVAALSLAAPFAGTPDVLVAVSPSFPALACAMADAKARRIPWVLWLQDILPDGAATTGLLPEGRLLDAARRFERAAYRSAAHIVVISQSFRDILLAKGVPEGKITVVDNPASRPILDAPRDPAGVEPGIVLTMGNIGHTQNLAAVVAAFQAAPEIDQARFIITGDGVAADSVRAAIHTDRVLLRGLLDSDALEAELRRATVALVSQRYDGLRFNVPSKIMNFMGHGIPVVALVPPVSEAARIVGEAGCGWVCDVDDAAAWGRTIADALAASDFERAARGEAGRRYAVANFSPVHHAERFAAALAEVLAR
jgi:colanic acid biosynthesis glycosyl transferase WcaI